MQENRQDRKRRTKKHKEMSRREIFYTKQRSFEVSIADGHGADSLSNLGKSSSGIIHNP